MQGTVRHIAFIKPSVKFKITSQKEKFRGKNIVLQFSRVYQTKKVSVKFENAMF